MHECMYILKAGTKTEFCFRSFSFIFQTNWHHVYLEADVDYVHIWHIHNNKLQAIMIKKTVALLTTTMKHLWKLNYSTISWCRTNGKKYCAMFCFIYKIYNFNWIIFYDFILFCIMIVYMCIACKASLGRERFYIYCLILNFIWNAWTSNPLILLGLIIFCN